MTEQCSSARLQDVADNVYIMRQIVTENVLGLQVTNQGLQACINNYVSAAVALSQDNTSSLTINNTYWLTISLGGAADLYEGVETLAAHCLSTVTATTTSVMTIDVSPFDVHLLKVLTNSLLARPPHAVPCRIAGSA